MHVCQKKWYLEGTDSCKNAPKPQRKREESAPQPFPLPIHMPSSCSMLPSKGSPRAPCPHLPVGVPYQRCRGVLFQSGTLCSSSVFTPLKSLFAARFKLSKLALYNQYAHVCGQMPVYVRACMRLEQSLWTRFCTF